MLSAAVFAVSGCGGFLDTCYNINQTDEINSRNAGSIWSFAYAFYAPLGHGLQSIDYNVFATVSDECQQTTAFVNNANVFSIADNAWAYYPEQGIDNRAGATYPRLTTQNNENNYQTSSLWVVDAGYIKLRNVELGYQFRKGPRLYVSGQNLLTFSPLLSKYNLDPESPDGYYPALKSITAGITIFRGGTFRTSHTLTFFPIDNLPRF